MEKFLNMIFVVVGFFLLAEGMPTTPMPDRGVAPGPVKNRKDAMTYLNYFNHMDMDSEAATEEDMMESMKDFQRMANIPMTGELDNDTMTMMNMPRCGVRDNMGMSAKERKKENGRIKRYNIDKRYPKDEITWRVSETPQDQAFSDAEVDEIMQRALQEWAAVTNLKFIHVEDPSAGPVDFDISFGKERHGDGNPFDGFGGVLAHAYFPQSGDINGIEGDAHFDDDEYFTDNTPQGTNLFQVAVHEFGHSLGLEHSEDSAAVMAPFYTDYQPDFELHEDDIAGIQKLYGKNVDEPDPTMKAVTQSVTDGGSDGVTDGSGTGDECPGFDLDAVVSIPTERDIFYRVTKASVYLLKGRQIWEVIESTSEPRTLAPGYPKAISDVFEDLPNNVDAGFSYFGQLFFFKGRKYHQYSGTTKVGSGRISNRFPGLPNNLDAAFLWSGNNLPYFVKGSRYFLYDLNNNQVDPEYPRSLSVWTDDIVPSFDASFRSYVYDRTYFFYQNKYFILNDYSLSLGRERDIGIYWFGCGSSALVQGDQDNGALDAVVPSMMLVFLSVVLNRALLL